MTWLISLVPLLLELHWKPEHLLWAWCQCVKKKKSISFETQLNTAQNNLRNGDISPIQFLNALTTSKHNNRLVDETWGLNHSRIDVLPEVEDSDEDMDSPGSEYVHSDTDDDA